MKKIISIVSAAVLSAAVLLPQTLSVSAATTADTLPYTLRFVPDRNFVSADEIAEGDVTIHASVYISGSTAHTIGAATVKFNSDSNNIYFQNMTSGGTRLSETQSYTYSGGSFTTSRLPFCFGTVTNGKYTTPSSMITTTQYACDPHFGAQITSNGDGCITFTSSPAYPASLLSGIDADTLTGASTLNWNSDSSEATITYVCPVTVGDNGIGSYTYDYIDRSTGLITSMTGTLPRYDASLEAGATIPDSCNSFVWIPSNDSQLTKGASFLGSTSDEFALFQVDIVIAQGTSCGVYNINFDDSVNSITGNQCQLNTVTSSDSKAQNYPLNYQGTSIAIGVESAQVTSIGTINNGYYTSENTNAICGSDFLDEVLATVTYTETDPETGAQKVETNVDITNLIDHNGDSASSLYLEQAVGNVYENQNDVLYLNGTQLTWSDNSPVTVGLQSAKKGDVNLDGNVDATDAYLVLSYYASSSVGADATLYTGDSTNPYMENFVFFLGDIDTCSKSGSSSSETLDANDAYYILQYYTTQSVGGSISWDSFVK